MIQIANNGVQERTAQKVINTISLKVGLVK